MTHTDAGKPLGLRTYPLALLLLLPTMPARAAEPQLPLMKEGLWESHTQRNAPGRKSESDSKICQTHDVEKAMRAQADQMMQAGHCTAVVTRPAPGTYVTESHCDKGLLAGTVTKTITVFQSETAVHLETHSTAGQTETTTIIDQRYVGSCPADMKPGDVIMPGGMKMNLVSP